MVYFAYGSNMLTCRLEQRVGKVEVLGVATLKQHRFQFDKESTDGSRKANVFYTGSDVDTVIGVLFQIDMKRKPDLDRAEGLGKGYELKQVDVLVENKIVQASTYFATTPDRSSKNLPYDWYLELILAGAKEHALPEEYTDLIHAQPTKSDKDVLRASKNRSILNP